MRPAFDAPNFRDDRSKQGGQMPIKLPTPIRGGARDPRGQLHDEGTLATLTIFSPDPPNPMITAQYNPKELEITRSVPWTKHQLANGGSPNKSKESAAERGLLSLEFTGTDSRSISVELLFDGFEDNQSVAPQVEVLEMLAQVRDPDSPKEEMRRPYRCVVVWGETLRNFRCVIESLAIKYTMFSRGGTPLRATCTVKLKEADLVKPGKGA